MVTIAGLCKSLSKLGKVSHEGCCFLIFHTLTHADVWLPCLQYPLCLKLLESSKVDVNPMITHRFGFSAKEVDAAFDTALRAATNGAIKVMFNLEGNDEDDEDEPQ